MLSFEIISNSCVGIGDQDYNSRPLDDVNVQKLVHQIEQNPAGFRDKIRTNRSIIVNVVDPDFPDSNSAFDYVQEYPDLKTQRQLFASYGDSRCRVYALDGQHCCGAVQSRLQSLGAEDPWSIENRFQYVGAYINLSKVESQHVSMMLFTIFSYIVW